MYVIRIVIYLIDFFKHVAAVDGLPENILPMHSNIHVEFRPYRRPTEEHQSKSDPATQDFINVPLSAATLASFAEAKARVEESFRESGPSPHPGQNVTIIPLGTGSAVPSKYRNGKIHFGSTCWMVK